MKMLTLTLHVGFLAMNCYLVWDAKTGRAAVIDPGGEPEKIQKALSDNGLTLAAILLTHGHYDHYLAAPALQKATGAPLYIHEADVEALADPGRFFAFTGFRDRLYTKPEDIRALRPGDSVTVDSLVFTYLHTPGHTPGSCLIACGGAWFSGDTLFAGEIGRVDLPGGDAEAMRRTLKLLAALKDDGPVYPGHDSATTLSFEQTHNPYILTGRL